MRDLDHGSSGWHVVLLGHGNIPVSKCRDLSSLRFEQKAPHFPDPVCGAFAIYSHESAATIADGSACFVPWFSSHPHWSRLGMIAAVTSQQRC